MKTIETICVHRLDIGIVNVPFLLVLFLCFVYFAYMLHAFKGNSPNFVAK